MTKMSPVIIFHVHLLHTILHTIFQSCLVSLASVESCKAEPFPEASAETPLNTQYSDWHTWFWDGLKTHQQSSFEIVAP